MHLQDDDRPDEQFIAAYRQTGSMEWMAPLFLRYSALVLGVCLKYLKNREEARDTTMQLFEKLPDLLMRHEITHFKAWLFATTRNHCLMILRSKKRHATEELPDYVMETWANMHPDNEFPEEDLEAMENCLARLNPAQQQCVRLFYLHKKSYAEVAEMSGLSVKAVKSNIQNGKRNLKICMEKHARLQR